MASVAVVKIQVYSDLSGWSWVAVDENDQSVETRGGYGRGEDAEVDARAAYPHIPMEYLDPPP